MLQKKTLKNKIKNIAIRGNRNGVVFGGEKNERAGLGNPA